MKRLDRITVTGSEIADSEGRAVTLRGLVVLTSFSDGRVLEMDDAAYERMRRWGLNAQVIRLESCRLGATLECSFEPAYVEKLRRWVDAAEAAGVYTIFKMTTYDSPSWGVDRAFSEERWDQFWDTSSGQQDAHLAGWSRVWEAFKGCEAVVGYDILNEPHAGRDATAFHARHLFPYLRRASSALRRIDPDVALVFQPAPNLVAALGVERFDDPHPIFAPHFYPLTRPAFDEMARMFKSLADGNGYPMNYMEFGWPDTEFRGILPAWEPWVERLMAEIFDWQGAGNIRPWYVHSPTWSVLNADGSEHAKMRFLSRPYPQRLAGRASGWSFDFDSRRFRARVTPASRSIQAPSEIFVAAARHYHEGFRLLIDGASVSLDGGGVSYDADGEILRIAARPSAMDIEVVPAA